MQESARTRAADGSPEQGAVADARIAQIAAWLGQFSRTLKTCRLYDEQNPNTLKFREDLGANFVGLLETHGAFTLEFGAREVRCDGRVVLASQTREDNLAMAFYRDGLRTLTFHPGAEPRELSVVLDVVLRVTARAGNGSEDLVTLLWDAEMPHLDMSYVSSETDADLGEDGDLVLGASVPHKGDLMPWPGDGEPCEPGPAGEERTADDPAGASGRPEVGGGAQGSAAAPVVERRSEDWLAGDPARPLEDSYRSLSETHTEDVERFVGEMRRERETPVPRAALDLARSALAGTPLAGDREDLTDLLERVLLESIAAADWQLAHETVEALAATSGCEWDPVALGEVLASPESTVTSALVRQLDASPLSRLQEFVVFARGLGPASIEWLMGIVAVAGHQRTRRTLVKVLGEMCEGNPERLAPWLGDPRWYVVRNAVLVTGSSPGGAPPGLFVPLLHHPDARVRQEVVAALANSDADAARPMLLVLLQDAEPSIRGSALHQLGARRSAQAAAAILKFVVEPGFRKRPADEVRSVMSALGGCAGDEVLAALEEQLYSPKWFNHGDGPYCQAIARCIARIGTPAATAALERGAASRAAATREACRQALKAVSNG